MIYKYREFGEYTDKIILNSELFFATYNSFNDPFDCNLDVNSYNNDEFDSYIDDFCESYPQTKSTLLKGQSKKEFREVIKSKLEEFKSHTGILSMSRKNKNILMWSHYSDHHKGLCLVLKK